MIPVATVADFKSTNHKVLKILGRLIAIVRLESDTFIALEAACKHQGANLFENYTNGTRLTCPRHNWVYDLVSGECKTNNSPPLRKYQLAIEDDKIFISLTPLEE